MNLRVIEGGLSKLLDNADSLPRVDAFGVRAEAVKRLKEAGYDQCRARNLATGQPIPRELRHLQMQIDLVAEKLAGLCPIPDDYHQDKYWPPRIGKPAAL